MGSLAPGNFAGRTCSGCGLATHAHTMAALRKRGEATATANREYITRIVDSLRVIVKAMRVSGRDVERKLGISAAQLHILQELRHRPSQSINELAARTYTHQSSVSMVVARLVDNRLATRSASGNDARKLAISLTPAGKAILKKSPSAAQGPIVAALERMPQSDLQELAESLRKLDDLLTRSDAPVA